MRRFIATIFVTLLIGGAAHGTDKMLIMDVYPLSCVEVLSSYAAANHKKNGTHLTHDDSFGRVIGFIGGYMTAAYHIREVIIKDFVDEVAWVASWCRDHKSFSLSNAMAALVNKRTLGDW